MSARTAFHAAIGFALACAISAFLLGIVATLLNNVTLGNVCGVLVAGLVAGGLMTVVICVSCDGVPKPKKRDKFSRADRQRLRDEQSRIEVDREIARMEREAGLR